MKTHIHNLMRRQEEWAMHKLLQCVCIVVCLPPTFVRGHVNKPLFVHSTLSLEGELKDY